MLLTLQNTGMVNTSYILCLPFFVMKIYFVLLILYASPDKEAISSFPCLVIGKNECNVS